MRNIMRDLEDYEDDDFLTVERFGRKLALKMNLIIVNVKETRFAANVNKKHVNANK